MNYSCKIWKYFLKNHLDIIFVVCLGQYPLSHGGFKNPNIASIIVNFDLALEFVGSDKYGIWLLNFNLNNFCVMALLFLFNYWIFKFTSFFQQICQGWTIFKALEKRSHHTLVFNDQYMCAWKTKKW